MRRHLFAFTRGEVSGQFCGLGGVIVDSGGIADEIEFMDRRLLGQEPGGADAEGGGGIGEK